MKFLDIVENGYASERNPRRIGIFIRKSGINLEMTDGKGSFWLSANDNEKLKVVGNLLDNNTESPSHGVTEAEAFGNDCPKGQCS